MFPYHQENYLFITVVREPNLLSWALEYGILVAKHEKKNNNNK